MDRILIHPKEVVKSQEVDKESSIWHMI
jgi:hypothetical protein